MAGALNFIQLYPALGKMVSDASNFWQGKDGDARERVLQHKIDDLLVLLRTQTQQMTRPKSCDASTQTDTIIPASPQFLSPQDTPRWSHELETPREWHGIVTGMGREEDLTL